MVTYQNPNFHWSNFQYKETTAQNAGLVTVAAGDTVILAPNVITGPRIQVNDRILFSFWLEITKGGVAGEVVITLAPDPADDPGFDFEYLAGQRPVYSIPNLQAAAVWRVYVTLPLVIIASTQLSHGYLLNGRSAGSDSTVAAGGCRMRLSYIRA